MPKTSQNDQKKAKLKINKIIIVFLARNQLNKLIQWAETAKNGFKCFKMHSNTYSPKREKKSKICQKITNNFKISQVTKYYEKMINM